MTRILAALAIVGSFGAGCRTPCQELATHAGGCGAAPQRWVDPRDSVCQQTRRELGRERFDAYASCVLASTCEDTGAVEACMEEHFADEEEACTRFRLWSSACGLEPFGTADACQGLASSAGAVGLTTYVDCVTGGGCPVPDDERWVRCQNILPPAVQQLLVNCEKIWEWSTRCQGQALSIFPVIPIPVPQCVAEAERFTIESHTNYADCLSEIDCPDIPARLDCILQLRFIEAPDITAQCTRLIEYSNGCGSQLGGGSLEACERLFPRFTPESFDAYIDCLIEAGCEDADAAGACSPLLVIQ